MKTVFYLFVVLFLSGCTFVEPEYKGEEKFELVEINGREIDVKAGATVYNPNGYKIKIKPADLDVYIDEVKIGVLHLDETIKLKAKSETEIYAPLKITVEKGMMFRLMALIPKGKIDVKLVGEVKAGVFLFFKKFDVKEVKTIDPSLF